MSGALATARRSLDAASRLRLAATLGVAGNKYVAWCAAQSVPVGQVASVPPGRERDWLAPLPLTYLPLEAETERRLRLLGLRTLGAFAALPAAAVQTQFGRTGLACWRLARASMSGRCWRNSRSGASASRAVSMILWLTG